MGVNEVRLSPQEEDDLRGLVVAGAATLTRRRAQRLRVLTSMAALAIVGAVAGGAAVTAGLWGRAPVAVAPSPTASDVPVPRPTATPPAPGAPPFGGDCASAWMTSEQEAAVDLALDDVPYSWRSGARDVLGAIDCLWISADETTTLSLLAYPTAVVPGSVREAVASGCTPLADGREQCRYVSDSASTWIMVEAVGPVGSFTAESIATLGTAVSARAADSPSGGPVARAPQWWPETDCASFVSALDARALGFDDVSLLDPPQESAIDPAAPQWVDVLAGAVAVCELHFTGGSEGGEVVVATVVPGGARAFDTVRAAGGEGVTLPAGGEAWWVTSPRRMDGLPRHLVATDGVNVLALRAHVQPDGRGPGVLAPLAAQILAALG